MATFMVVARFREDTDMSEVFEVVAEEQAADDPTDYMD